MPLFKARHRDRPQIRDGACVAGIHVWLDRTSRRCPRRSNKKAYELRDRASDREKFFITATYELQVTGNLEKAQQTCELWLHTYPREKVPHGLLGACCTRPSANTKKVSRSAKQLVEIDPDFPIGYLQLAFNNQFAGHLEEAEHALQRAADRKLEIPELLIQRYDIAFLKGDQAGMDREVALGEKESGAEDMIADRQAFVWAYSGHLEKANVNGPACGRLESAAGPAGKKSADRDRTGAMGSLFRESCLPQTERAMAAADLSTDRDVEYGAAFALALSGEPSRSRALAKDLDTRFPEDSAVQFIYLPADSRTSRAE